METGARGMTDTISDEARELTQEVWIIGNRLTSFDTKKTEIAAVIQYALTAARTDERNKALEDAANACEMPSVPGGDIARTELLCADAIRAMKVQL